MQGLAGSVFDPQRPKGARAPWQKSSLLHLAVMSTHAIVALALHYLRLDPSGRCKQPTAQQEGCRGNKSTLDIGIV